MLLLALLVAIPNAARNRAAAYPGDDGAESIGYFIGAIVGPFVLPGLLVPLYYFFRKSRRTAHRVFLVFAIWSLVMALLSSAGSLMRPQQSAQDALQRDIGRIVREAASGVPPSRSSGKWDTPMRQFFDDVFAMRREYEKEVAQFKAPELAQLYAPASFSSRSQVERTLEKLREMAALDRKYADFEPIIERMKSRVQAMDVSEKDKKDFINGVETGFRNNNAPREKVIQKELEWADATIELYDLALNNYPAFSVKGAQVIISSPQVLETYNLKLTRARELQQEFLHSTKELEESQKRELQKFGVAPGELSGQPAKTPPPKP